VVEAPTISRRSALEGGKVVSRTHRQPLPRGKIPGNHFCYRLNRLQGNSAAGRMKSMNNSNNPIANRTRNLSACGAVPLPTTLPRTPMNTRYAGTLKSVFCLEKVSNCVLTLDCPVEESDFFFGIKFKTKFILRTLNK
jgi:hypothetical protein